MIFASQIFLFWFLPAVLLLYYAVPFRAKTLLLLAASFLFYGWWRPDFIVLMLASTVLDYFVGLAIESASKPRARKTLLVASCVANLGLLAYFKYANFGIETLNGLLGWMGAARLSWVEVVLPVGISFYTFQSMSYTIDVYRGEVRATMNFIDFACFVALFPQLVAGPVVRYKDLADQLRERTHDLTKFAAGVFLLQIGFAKKILIADTIAPIADAAFALREPGFVDAWLGTVAYGFQIYFDFSGYSDMAIGLGLMLGFQFPLNFDAPYKATSITDFWRRWHITLSTWLRDYLYVPLGGNRKGPAKTYAFLMITMLLGGLWHGAAWTFVLWGAYQGLFLVIERLLGKKPIYARAPVAIQVAATFLIAMGGWVFFRATSVDQAFRILGAMVNPFAAPQGERLVIATLPGVMLVVAAVVTWAGRPAHTLVKAPGWAATAGAASAFALAVIHFYFQSYSPFLYFQF